MKIQKLVAILLIVSAPVIFVSITYRESRLPDHSVFFNSSNGLYETMKQDGSFNNNFIFLIIETYSSLKKRLKTGEYPLHYKENTYSFALRLLCNGFIKHKITFREGLTVYQIIEKLNNEPILAGEITKTPKEGSLMPDTYFYKFGDSRQSIIDRMKSEMDDFKSRIKNKTKLTIDEIIILASMIEQESGSDKDRPLISSVFHNRLAKGMKLESDPTVIYALTKNGKYMGAVSRQRILHKDLKVDSPYNTYKNKGLPIGAICCPGKASILAAINPANTEFLYFVSDIKNKETFYSKTFNQHVKYKKLINSKR